MLEITDEQSEFIYDGSLQQLAVNIGIFGSLCGVVVSIVYNLVMMSYIEASSQYNLLFLQLGVVSSFGFIFSILTSIGYVGIFSLKRSTLGIIFPLIAITNYYGFRIYIAFLSMNNLFSTEVMSTSSTILTYATAIIEALILFSIREKSNNLGFLSFFAVFTLVEAPLSSVIWRLIFGDSFQLTSGLDYFIGSLPGLMIGFIGLGLLLIFFSIERKEVFVVDDSHHDSSYY